MAQGFLPFSTYGIILVHSIYLSLLVFFQGNLLLSPFHLSFVCIAIIPPSYPCSLVTSSFHTFSLFTLTFSFPLFNNSPKPHKCIYQVNMQACVFKCHRINVLQICWSHNQFWFQVDFTSKIRIVFFLCDLRSLGKGLQVKFLLH